MKHYIPRRVILPFGYIVKIKQLYQKKWKAAYKEAFNDSAHNDTLAFSYPQENGAVIVLKHNRTTRERKEDLIHELQHVMVEYQEYVKGLD